MPLALLPADSHRTLRKAGNQGKPKRAGFRGRMCRFEEMLPQVTAVGRKRERSQIDRRNHEPLPAKNIACNFDPVIFNFQFLMPANTNLTQVYTAFVRI